MIPNALQGSPSLSPTASAPAAAASPGAPPPRLALERAGNRPPARQRPLDLARCPATPWQGAGSLPAVTVLRNQDCWRVKATADPSSSAMEVALGKLLRAERWPPDAD